MRPAEAGATRRMVFITAELRATPFINRSIPTSSGVIACREGMASDITAPCTNDAASRCSTRSMSKKSSSAITSAFSAFTVWPASITYFFGMRSATTPPTSESEIQGIAFISAITPSIAYDPVSWNTR